MQIGGDGLGDGIIRCAGGNAGLGCTLGIHATPG